jgi:uncharacterized phage infection (PIP) family protein YhgE
MYETLSLTINPLNTFEQTISARVCSVLYCTYLSHSMLYVHYSGCGSTSNMKVATITTILMVVLAVAVIATPLDDYVNKPDPNYKWSNTGIQYLYLFSPFLLPFCGLFVTFVRNCTDRYHISRCWLDWLCPQYDLTSNSLSTYNTVHAMLYCWW